VSAFDRIFVSSELGFRKPERAAFDAVSDTIEVAPRNILFFDDTLENVEGARRAALNAVLVTRPADLLSAVATVISELLRSRDRN